MRLRRGENKRRKHVHSLIPPPLASTAPLLGGLFQESLQGDGERAALDLERPHFLSRRRLYVRVGINLAFRPPAALMLDAVLIRDRLSTLKSFSTGFDMTNVVKSNPEKRIREYLVPLAGIVYDHPSKSPSIDFAWDNFKDLSTFAIYRD